MDFFKLGQYLKIIGYILIAINILSLIKNVPSSPTVADYERGRNYFTPVTRDEIDQEYIDRLGWHFSCIYSTTGCIASANANLAYRTYFAVFLIILGVVFRKSAIKPEENEEE